MRKATLLVAAIVALAIVLAGCGQKVDIPDPVATVNGEGIDSDAYLQQVHQTAGKRVLESMIEQKIMTQWAKDEGVAPTDEQVEKQLDALKREGEYEDRVKQAGEEGVKSQLEVQQAVTNIGVKLYKIGDKELKEVYDMRKPNYVHGPRKRVAIIMNADKRKMDEAAKKIKDGKDFDEVATSVSGGQFNPFGSSGAIKTWIEPGQAGLPKELSEVVKGTKIDGVSKVVKLPSPPGAPASYTQYVLVKVLSEQPKANLKVKDVKEELRAAAAMQKIQMNSQEFQKKLNERKKKAKVEVAVESFKDVVTTINNPQDPQPMGGMQPRMAPPSGR